MAEGARVRIGVCAGVDAASGRPVIGRCARTQLEPSIRQGIDDARRSGGAGRDFFYPVVSPAGPGINHRASFAISGNRTAEVRPGLWISGICGPLNLIGGPRHRAPAQFLPGRDVQRNGGALDGRRCQNLEHREAADRKAEGRFDGE